MGKRLRVVLLKYAIGFGLLTWGVWSHWDIQISENNQLGLADVLNRVPDWLFLTLSVVASLSTMLFTFARWWVLVRAQRLGVSSRMVVRLSLLGFFLNTFLPGNVSGDIFKVVYLSRRDLNRIVAVSTVIIDRLIGLCALFWLVALVGCCAWVAGTFPHVASEQGYALLRTVFIIASLCALCTLAAWILVGFFPDRPQPAPSASRVRNIAAELYSAFASFRDRGSSIVTALFLAVAAHGTLVLAFYFAALAFFSTHEIPSFGVHLILVPIGIIVQAGFPTPGGIGGGELVFGYFYQSTGFSFTAGLLASVLRRLISWILALTAYFMYLHIRPESVKAD